MSFNLALEFAGWGKLSSVGQAEVILKHLNVGQADLIPKHLVSSQG
jgi:hypothetical protein